MRTGLSTDCKEEAMRRLYNRDADILHIFEFCKREENMVGTDYPQITEETQNRTCRKHSGV